MRSHLLAVALLVVACGGKVVVTEPPETDPVTPVTPSTPSKPVHRPQPTSPISYEPYPAPPPVSTSIQDPLPAPSTPAPSTPPPEPPLPDIGAKLAPTVVKCAPGESVEMSFRIPAEQMAQGASDEAGAGYCTGVVKFEATTFDGSYWDTTTSPWTRVSAVANGRSYNPDPQDIPGHVHSSTLVYADGRTEPQYCSFWAMCENGVAKGVWFTW